MEKKVYELTISEALEHVMPPLQEMELTLLTQSLLSDGCRDPLVVWNGMIIDGHNRYRICQEHSIPFTYVEMNFEDETEAREWIIRNQLARRNVPDYVRCEMVLPLEEKLKAQAKKRQGWKKADVLPNLEEGNGKRTTLHTLANMAGVSNGTFDKAKKLIDGADEETKEKLRKGEISIHRAYTEMKEKQNEAQTPWETDDVEENESIVEKKPGDIVPGFGVKQILESAPKVIPFRPPDSVYDIPPIEVYGNIPPDNPVLRGNVEIAHAKADLNVATEFYIQRVSDILRGMSAASRNPQNANALRELVITGFSQIMDMLNNEIGGIENE